MGLKMHLKALSYTDLSLSKETTLLDKQNHFPLPSAASWQLQQRQSMTHHLPTVVEARACQCAWPCVGCCTTNANVTCRLRLEHLSTSAL